MLSFSFYFYGENTLSYLQQKESAIRLIVNWKPLMIFGGELDNSSVSSVREFEQIFPKLQQAGLNTVFVSVYWDLFIPEERALDFTLTDKVIDQTQKNDLRVVFLWSGVWEKRMRCYTSKWFKRVNKKYLCEYTKVGEPLKIARAFPEDVFKPDRDVFSRWISHTPKINKQ